MKDLLLLDQNEFNYETFIKDYKNSILEKYKGFKIIPIKNNTKQVDLSSGYLEYSKEQLDILFLKSKSDSVGIINGKENNLIVLDIDVKENKQNKFWNDYISENGDILTPKVETPSGGFHYYFSYDERFEGISFKINKNNYNIDLKVSRGYTVIPPSFGYTWINDINNFKLIKFPDDLFKIFVQNKRNPKVELFNYINHNNYDKTVYVLDNLIESEDYSVWISVGMVLKNVFKESGFQLWDNWSKRSNKYKDNETILIWNNFNEDGDLKIGTLFYLAKIINPEKYQVFINKYKINHIPIGYNGYRNVILDYYKTKLIYPSKHIIYLWNDIKKIYDELTQIELVNHIYETLYNVLHEAKKVINNMLTPIKYNNKDIIMVSNEQLKEKLMKQYKILSKDSLTITEHYCYNFTYSLMTYCNYKEKYLKFNNPNKEELPIKNGKIINLKTGDIRIRTKEDLYSFELNVDYVSLINIDVQNKLSFIYDIFNNNQDYIDLLQKILGYSLTGETYENKLFIFYGSGANGKSTLLNLFKTIFDEYFTYISKEVLIKYNDDKSKKASPELETLVSKRIGILEETDQDDKFNESRLKKLTGCETINYRPLFSKELKVDNYCKFIICTNNKPNFDIDDEALVRRIEYLPFEMKFVDIPKKTNEKQKKNIKLDEELNNIFFSWCVNGSLNWYKNGFIDTLLNNIKQQNLEEQNTIKLFLNECIESTELEEDFIPARVLYNDNYIPWCKNNDYNYVSNKKFGEKLKEYNYNKKRVTNYIVYLKIKLKII